MMFAVCGMTATHAGATNYYVSGSGSDGDAGTEAAPWRTIQKAADIAQAGDTVLVRTGAYSRVTVKTSGTSAANRITFTSYPGEKPVIDETGTTPPSGNTALFLLEGRKHVTIRGFELRNYQTANKALIPAGILITGATEDIIISACNVHDIWNTGGNTSNSGNAFGIAVYGDSVTPAKDIVIDGNEVHHLKTGASESVVINGNVTNFQVTKNLVHDNNNIGIDFIGYEGTCPDPAQDRARDGVCRGNTVWNITSEGNQAYTAGDYSADGIYCDGATRVLIEGNISYKNDIGVELAAELAGKLTSGITLRNNFIHSNRQTGLFLGGYASSGTGGTEGCTITGNTFYNNDTLGWDNGEVQLRYRTSNCVFRGNIFSAGPGGWLVSIPVPSANNTNNKFDYNLYHAASPSWSWNNSSKTTLAAWKTACGSDVASLFTDPRFISTAATPDLHLRLDSPAIDAGDPAYATSTGETDIDAAKRITGTRIDIGADELVPMDAWRKKHFGSDAMNSTIAAAGANPAGDGINNLLKYVVGLDPKARTNALPWRREETIDGARYLSLQYTHNATATDVEYVVEVSGNLSNWSPSTVEVSRVRAGDIETIVARDPLPMAGQPARFMRVRATQP